MVFAERLQNHPAKKLVCNIHPEWRLFPKTPALHHIDPVIKTVLTTMMFINPKQSIATILHGLQKKYLKTENTRPPCIEKPPDLSAGRKQNLRRYLLVSSISF